MRAHSHFRHSVAVAAVPALLLALNVVPRAAKATPTELFNSGYIEGTSNNKALEIFNGSVQTTTVTVPLEL